MNQTKFITDTILAYAITETLTYLDRECLAFAAGPCPICSDSA